jgi:hypothetical protein
MDTVFCGPRLLSEEDIPGSALSGRKPSALKNSELKFWLQCRGDSCKGLKTKALLVKRQVNKMAFNNAKIVIKYISFY